jgi:hypothetical protein
MKYGLFVVYDVNGVLNINEAQMITEHLYADLVEYDLYGCYVDSIHVLRLIGRLIVLSTVF